MLHDLPQKKMLLDLLRAGLLDSFTNDLNVVQLREEATPEEEQVISCLFNGWCDSGWYIFESINWERIDYL